MFKFSRSILAGAVIALALAACPGPAHASPPPDTSIHAIIVQANTASATFTCNGPATCVFASIVDSVSGAIVHAAQSVAAGSGLVASMSCPASGGLLVWRSTVVGSTVGMADSPASTIRTSGNCPLAVSPGASVTATPITVTGGP